MPRLIEIHDVTVAGTELVVRVGDVLWFSAGGGRAVGERSDADAGSGVLRVLGPFLPAVVGPAGQIVSPAGSPNTLLVLAARPGRETLEVATGDPFGPSPRLASVSITVQP